MEILKQIEAKNKIKAVIESCITYEQTFTAENLVKLYYDKFEDLVGKVELLRTLFKLRETLKLIKNV